MGFPRPVSGLTHTHLYMQTQLYVYLPCRLGWNLPPPDACRRGWDTERITCMGELDRDLPSHTGRTPVAGRSPTDGTPSPPLDSSTALWTAPGQFGWNWTPQEPHIPQDPGLAFPSHPLNLGLPFPRTFVVTPPGHSPAPFWFPGPTPDLDSCMHAQIPLTPVWDSCFSFPQAALHPPTPYSPGTLYTVPGPDRTFLPSPTCPVPRLDRYLCYLYIHIHIHPYTGRTVQLPQLVPHTPHTALTRQHTLYHTKPQDPTHTRDMHYSSRTSCTVPGRLFPRG